MSVRSADPAALRDLARDVRTQAARTGLHAWRVQGLSDDALRRWWGGHAVLWTGRSRSLALDLRASEARLRRVADGADRWADVAQDAQRRLDDLDREEEQVRTAQAWATAAWDAADPVTRGLRPDASWQLAALAAQRQAVEEQAAMEGLRFARVVDGALAGLGGRSTPVDAFRWVTGSAPYQWVTQTAAVRDLAKETRRGADALEPYAKRVPKAVKAVDGALGPLGIASDVDTLINDVPDGSSGVKDWLDYGAAAANVAVVGGAAAAAAAGVTAVGGVEVAAVATAAGTVLTVYGIGSAVFDAVSRTASPSRTAAAQSVRRTPPQAAPPARTATRRGAGVLAAA